MGRWQAQGAWMYWLMALLACLLWLVCGPLNAAPASSPASAPASAAASAATADPGYEERLRRCNAQPVRAVREECLRRVRKDFDRP